MRSTSIPSGWATIRTIPPGTRATSRTARGAHCGTKIAGLGLAQGPDNPLITDETKAATNGDYWKFGSWHLGGCQFVFGDTRVVAVKNSADPMSLYYMSVRDDGTPYSLQQ